MCTPWGRAESHLRSWVSVVRAPWRAPGMARRAAVRDGKRRAVRCTAAWAERWLSAPMLHPALRPFLGLHAGPGRRIPCALSRMRLTALDTRRGVPSRDDIERLLVLFFARFWRRAFHFWRTSRSSATGEAISKAVPVSWEGAVRPSRLALFDSYRLRRWLGVEDHARTNFGCREVRPSSCESGRHYGD